MIWLVFAFVLLVVIALSWSIAPWQDRLSALHKYGKLLYLPFLYPLCVEKKWREYTVGAFLLGMIVTVVLLFRKHGPVCDLVSLHTPAMYFIPTLKPAF